MFKRIITRWRYRKYRKEIRQRKITVEDIRNLFNEPEENSKTINP